MNGFGANMQTTEASSRPRTSMRNEKQKHLVDSLTSERIEMWGESYSMLGHASNIENVASSNQSRDLRARRREEKNPIISTSRGSRSPTQIVVDSNINVEYNEKGNTFWFSLVASDNQRCKAPLEQIPSRYLRVKDGNITVSSIKKYLMQKLNLWSENEVEISLQGRLLLPSLQICKLLDLWLRTTAPLEKKKAFIGSSARDFVLTLTYSRRPMLSA
ncbi:DREB2A-interacting protein 2 [Perilla frutescens var. hirtella]|uniref:DREB2A-interacting protein 2 n=1 Tax=Perilla frutescens var. hirtella TaxID=608512 RepID=A0AAD4JIH2_PERFH|nr:DREB2A-interacting protein 2 [Perilla frutescens var. hirtella]